MRSFYTSLLLLSASLVISGCVKDSSNANLPPVAHDANFCPTSADMPSSMISEFKTITPVYGGILIGSGRGDDQQLLLDGSEHLLPGTEGRNPQFYRGGCSSPRSLTIHSGSKKFYRTVVFEHQDNGDYIEKEMRDGKVEYTRTIKRPRPPTPAPPPPPPPPPVPPPVPEPPHITIPKHSVDQCPKQEDFGTGSENGNVDIKNIANGITMVDPDHSLLQIDGTIQKGPVQEGATYAGGCDNRTITVQFLNDVGLSSYVIKPNGHGYRLIYTNVTGQVSDQDYPPKAKGN
jgi:hypothetical protein